MVRRILLSGAILLVILLLVPACSRDHETDGKGGTPLRPDEAVPAPRAAGKSG